MNSFPILTTHGLTSTPTSPTHINTNDFIQVKQFADLHNTSFQPLRTNLFQTSLQASTTNQPNCICLTCDDALESILKIAEILQSPSSVFVVTGHVGKYNNWHHQPSWVPHERCLNWNHLRELAKLGWTIGAHSCSHSSFRKLSPKEIKNEIVNSKNEIEDQIGIKCNFFAFPYGHTTTTAKNILNEMEMLGLGTVPGWTGAGSSQDCLPRIDLYDIVNHSTNLRWLKQSPTYHELKLLNVRRQVGSLLKFFRNCA